MARVANPKRNGRHNGVWGRYVGRLERVTRGRSMRSPYCHNYKAHSPEEIGTGQIVVSRRTSTTRTAIDPVCEMTVDPCLYQGSPPSYGRWSDGAFKHNCCA